MAVEVRKWVTFTRGDPRGGRASPRQAAAPRRRRRRAQEPVRGRVVRGHLRAHRRRRVASATSSWPVQGGARRPGRGVRQGRHRRRAGRARARRGAPPPEVRRAGPRRGRTASRSCRRSRSAAAMGAHLDIPVHHIKAMLVRTHFDAMEICVPDAPATDELARRAGGDQRRPAARPRRRPQGRGRRRRGRAPLSAGRPDPMRTLITGLGEVVSGDIAGAAARRRLDPDRGRADRGDRSRPRRGRGRRHRRQGRDGVSRADRLARPPGVRRLDAAPAHDRLHRVRAARRRHVDDLGGRGPPPGPAQGHRRAQGARDRRRQRRSPTSARRA